MGIKWHKSSNDVQVASAANQTGGKIWKVTFSTGCDTEIEVQNVKDRGRVKEPESPKKEGHTFGGWFKDDKTTEAYAFKSPVTSDITLYAKWTVNEGDSDDKTDGEEAGGDK